MGTTQRIKVPSLAIILICIGVPIVLAYAIPRISARPIEGPACTIASASRNRCIDSQ